MAKLVAYDQQAVLVILRDWTVDRLVHELDAGCFGAHLSGDERAFLVAVAHAWSRRALGLLSLRDALMIDQQRGSQIYPLICAEMTRAVCTVPEASLIRLDGRVSTILDGATVQAWLTAVADNPSPASPIDAPAGAGCLSELLECVQREQLTLIYAANDLPDYPLPDLERLLPDPPASVAYSNQSFEPPRGWRRGIAIVLASAGIISLIVPLIAGELPRQPAGWPLALLTTALLVGIRAGIPGYIGAFCIWMVANLPSFHHGRLVELLQAVPLFVVGVVFLIIDRRIRLLWSWIWRRQHLS